MNWTGIDHTSLFGRAVRLPLKLLPKSTMMAIRRGSARGLKWRVGACNHGCWLGTYELDKQRALQRFVRDGMTVYDIGAQAGFYTLMFSRLVGPGGHVYAFEPCCIEARELVRHVTVNRLANVTVLQVAIADQAAMLPFTVTQGTTMNALTAESVLLVPTARLDDFPYRPQVIKMDVEGAESRVLRGGRRLIESAKPVLFIALHGREQFEAVTELLREFRYDKFALDGTPIPGTPETDEIYALPSAP